MTGERFPDRLTGFGVPDPYSGVAAAADECAAARDDKITVVDPAVVRSNPDPALRSRLRRPRTGQARSRERSPGVPPPSAPQRRPPSARSLPQAGRLRDRALRGPRPLSSELPWLIRASDRRQRGRSATRTRDSQLSTLIAVQVPVDECLAIAGPRASTGAPCQWLPSARRQPGKLAGRWFSKAAGASTLLTFRDTQHNALNPGANSCVPRTRKGVAVGGFSDAVLCRR